MTLRCVKVQDLCTLSRRASLPLRTLTQKNETWQTRDIDPKVLKAWDKMRVFRPKWGKPFLLSYQTKIILLFTFVIKIVALPFFPRLMLTFYNNLQTKSRIFSLLFTDIVSSIKATKWEQKFCVEMRCDFYLLIYLNLNYFYFGFLKSFYRKCLWNCWVSENWPYALKIMWKNSWKITAQTLSKKILEVLLV